jgi:hypothetical protein
MTIVNCRNGIVQTRNGIVLNNSAIRIKNIIPEEKNEVELSGAGIKKKSGLKKLNRFISLKL